MCTNSSKLSPCSPLYIAFSNRKPPRRGSNLLHRRRLSRRRISKWSKQAKHNKEKKVAIVKKVIMEIKNLKLYMKNKSIIEENEKLRKKAFLLHQENQGLLFQLQALNSHHLL